MELISCCGLQLSKNPNASAYSNILDKISSTWNADCESDLIVSHLCLNSLQL